MYHRVSGEKIRKARTAAGLTQAELAGKVGVTHSAVSYFESGKTDPSAGTLRDIARVLGGTMESYMTNKAV